MFHEEGNKSLLNKPPSMSNISQNQDYLDDFEFDKDIEEMKPNEKSVDYRNNKINYEMARKNKMRELIKNYLPSQMEQMMMQRPMSENSVDDSQDLASSPSQNNLDNVQRVNSNENNLNVNVPLNRIFMRENSSVCVENQNRLVIQNL